MLVVPLCRPIVKTWGGFNELPTHWWPGGTVTAEWPPKSKELNHPVNAPRSVNLRVDRFKQWLHARTEGTVMVVSHGYFLYVARPTPYPSFVHGGSRSVIFPLRQYAHMHLAHIQIEIKRAFKVESTVCEMDAATYAVPRTLLSARCVVDDVSFTAVCWRTYAAIT